MNDGEDGRRSEGEGGVAFEVLPGGVFLIFDF